MAEAGELEVVPLPLLFDGRAGVDGLLEGLGAGAEKASVSDAQALSGRAEVVGLGAICSTAGRLGPLRSVGSQRKPVSSASERCLVLPALPFSSEA